MSAFSFPRRTRRTLFSRKGSGKLPKIGVAERVGFEPTIGF